MKSFKFFIIAIFLLILICGNAAAQTRGGVQQMAGSVPFSKGVNMTKWFEGTVWNAVEIHFRMFDESDFIFFKNIGVDVIRLPVNFHAMTSGAPNFIVDPLLFRLLDQVVDWAEKHQIYIVLDNHYYARVPAPLNNIQPSPLTVARELPIIWRQIADHFKNRSEYVLYEIFNEPNNITARQWGQLQGQVIDAIRSVDTKHTIVVSAVSHMDGVAFDSFEALFSLPNYSDRNLIYTFHFYDPFIFTCQGAPPLNLLTGVPFPYDRNRMPPLPDTLRNTWVDHEMRAYENNSNLTSLTRKLNRVVEFSRRRNVPVFCGEFGVLYTVKSEDKNRWLQTITNLLNERNIPWTIWEYSGHTSTSFGMFNTPNGNHFSELNVELARAIGFNPPPQRPRSTEALRSGFTIYDDYFGRDYWVWYPVSTNSDAKLHLFDTNAADGEFAIRWENPLSSRYDTIWIDNVYEQNYSFLVQSGAYLEFKARTNKPVSINVLFLNPEIDSLIPWIMYFTVDSKVLPPDGRWHTIRIPLRNMTEQGGLQDVTYQWHNPRGQFTWNRINRIQIAMNNQLPDVPDATIWFDSIRIVRP
ncbi:MAG: glycoside hydrolase family 5 protein [Treponema sp.]|nr:glycoside hydrolase family 5 protein [Treponema sp.]